MRAAGEWVTLAEAMLGVAQIAVDHGDAERAASTYEASLHLSRELGSTSSEGMAQFGLGSLARSRGDLAAPMGNPSRSMGTANALWNPVLGASA